MGAEEGECNDDGVELKPSLRIKNLPSPKRGEKDQTPKRSRKVMLKVKTSPVTPTPIPQEAKPVPPPQPIREAISSDDDSEPEKEIQPQINEKEPEKEIVTENEKITTVDESESLDKSAE